MPEGAEIDTDALRETIDQEIEKEGGGRLLRLISFSTALIAALGAVAALQAGDTVNEALGLKSDAATLQGQASDQWALYQAKGVKGAVADAIAATWLAAGKPVPATVSSARYATEQRGIEKEARAFEAKRDLVVHEADELLSRHHRYANAVALFQVAIALGAISALTRMRVVWFGSLFLGAAGLAFFLWPLLAT